MYFVCYPHIYPHIPIHMPHNTKKEIISYFTKKIIFIEGPSSPSLVIHLLSHKGSFFYLLHYLFIYIFSVFCSEFHTLSCDGINPTI